MQLHSMLTHNPVSADRQYIKCPDCATPCIINITFLTDNGGLLYIASCDVCADNRTIRATSELTRAEWLRLKHEGVLVIHYGKK